MILSNEQRAHDIVISMLPVVVDHKVEAEHAKSLDKNTPAKKVEVVPLYLEMYESALKKLNDLHPES